MFPFKFRVNSLRFNPELAWDGQVTRYDNLSQTILQVTSDGGQRRGRQRKCWTDNVKSGHPCPCQNRSQWPWAEKTGRGRGHHFRLLICLEHAPTVGARNSVHAKGSWYSCANDGSYLTDLFQGSLAISSAEVLNPNSF